MLPAHGHPFDDLRGRVKDIDATTKSGSHAPRGGERARRGTVEELSQHLFRQRSWGPMAESETYAHLEHLRLSGQATREEKDGTLLYSLV